MITCRQGLPRGFAQVGATRLFGDWSGGWCPPAFQRDRNDDEVPASSGVLERPMWVSEL